VRRERERGGTKERKYLISKGKAKGKKTLPGGKKGLASWKGPYRRKDRVVERKPETTLFSKAETDDRRRGRKKGQGDKRI